MQPGQAIRTSRGPPLARAAPDGGGGDRLRGTEAKQNAEPPRGGRYETVMDGRGIEQQPAGCQQEFCATKTRGRSQSIQTGPAHTGV